MSIFGTFQSYNRCRTIRSLNILSCVSLDAGLWRICAAARRAGCRLQTSSASSQSLNPPSRSAAQVGLTHWYWIGFICWFVCCFFTSKVHSHQIQPTANTSYCLGLVTSKASWFRVWPTAKLSKQMSFLTCALSDGSVSGNISTSSSCSETYTSYSDIKPWTLQHVAFTRIF